MQSRWGDRDLLRGCICPVGALLHSGHLGCAAGDHVDQRPGQALLGATTGTQGTGPWRLAVLPAVCARGFAQSPRKEEGRRRREEKEPGNEAGSRGPGAGEEVSLVFRAPGSPQRPAALRAHPLAPGCTFISHSPGQGALWLPATPAFCTLVCMSNNVPSQCHPPHTHHVWRVPDWHCLTHEPTV